MRESWWKLLLCSFVHDASPTPEIPVSRPLFQEFAISCPGSSTNLHLPPPYSTDQRRSFDPKILDRDYSRNELNFSERRFRFHFRSLPESNPEEEIDEGRNDETLA